MPKFKNSNPVSDTSLIKDDTKERYRWWSVVCYPESIYPNWIEYLDALHIPFAVSPLHDRDINPDGEVKKAHYHCVLYFEGKKSYYQIKHMFDSLGGSAPPEPCHSPRGAIRYFAHLDNPEKFQYNFHESLSFGGLDLAAILELSFSDKQKCVRDMTKFIVDNQVASFSAFAMYCAENNHDWFYVLNSCNTFYFNALIRSQFHDISAKYLDIKVKNQLLSADVPNRRKQ